MTRNRDRRIWAVAARIGSEVDDSNTPLPIDAQTNEPGRGPAVRTSSSNGHEALAEDDHRQGTEG